MIYLLDVNALLALGYPTHVHHRWVSHWLAGQQALHAPSTVKLATCAITELGFVRIATGPTRLAASVAEARLDLLMLKLRERMMLISDRLVAAELPSWVSKSPQTTDGHLLGLAKANGASLATFDQSIPGAVLIPSTAESHSSAPFNLAMHCRCTA